MTTVLIIIGVAAGISAVIVWSLRHALGRDR